MLPGRHWHVIGLRHCAAAMRTRYGLTSVVLVGLLGAVSCGGDDEIAPGGNDTQNTGNTGATSSNGGKGNTGGTKGDAAEAGVGATGNTGNTGDGGSDASPGGKGPVGDSCAAAWEGEAAEPTVACDLDALDDSGVTISGDITSDMTLESGKSYKLDGPVRVMPGATLIIPPCVKILGQSPQSILVAMAGTYDGQPGGKPGQVGKIEAIGEANAPIVFTSNKAAGSRRPGDWGGVMMLGNAIENGAKRTADVVGRPTIEGLTAQVEYGWDTEEFNEESSGSLVYVRIEYASREVSAGSETNGLTFGAVGSGTTVHHVMVSNSNDDCFEWFGGTVNASHLIAFNCDDDMFDTDRGFSGHVQFAFGRQIEGTLETDSNGFEMDNSGLNYASARPRTLAEWSNITICGTESEPTSGTTAPRVGMGLRSGVGGGIKNAIVTGFDNGGMFVDTDTDGLITVTSSSVFDNVTLYTPAIAGTKKHVVGDSWFQDQPGNSTERPEGFCDCFSDPPTPWPTTRIEGEATAGFDDAKASYQGAFKDASAKSNWMRGKWVDWSNE